MAINAVRALDHIGLTVPDLDEAETFFVEVLGGTPWYRLGSKRDPGGTWMTEHLNVHPDSIVNEVRFVRLPGGTVLELFSYTAPGQSRRPPRNSDVGAIHLAFYVDDLDAAVRELRERGLEVQGSPTVSKGANAGQRWVYFLAPWGLQCELVSYPEGRAIDLHPGRFA